MRNVRTLVGVAAIVFLVVPSACSAASLSDSCFHYWPVVVELRGKLVATVKYGPPNYGENPKTDKKYTVPILHLPSPITMCKDSIGDPLKNVKEIQVNTTPAKAAAIYNRVVRVKGTLGPPTRGPDYTKVIMTADTIAAEIDPRRRAH